MTRVLFIFSLFTLIACEPTVNSKDLKDSTSISKTEKNPFEDLTALVDLYAQTTLEHGNINALAVAIYKDGKSYENYYGEIDPGQNNLPTNQTLFEMASVSKVLLGSLTARAVVEEKIALDDDIRKYLPGEYPNLEYEGHPVTIKDLVTHTLGFDNPPKLDAVYEQIFSETANADKIDYDLDQLFEELHNTTLDTLPGTHYDYSNLGPELVAHALEQVYNKPYNSLLSDFFQELKMENSYLEDYDAHKDALANGYNENGEVAALDFNPLIGGAGGVISTLPDLTRFMKFLLESQDPLIQEATQYLHDDGDGDGTGYFWDLGFAEREGFYYQKTGSSNGVQSVVMVCPDSNYGMIVIMNNQSDEAMNDWFSLYNRTEIDLIEYPKINAWSSVQETFLSNPKEAQQKYKELSADTASYFANSDYLNSVGYDYIFNNQVQTAIQVFKLAIAEDPDNANLHDSLGEAYFIAEDYDQSKTSYEKSLELNPANEGAKEYLIEIASLTKNN